MFGLLPNPAEGVAAKGLEGAVNSEQEEVILGVVVTADAFVAIVKGRHLRESGGRAEQEREGAGWPGDGNRGRHGGRRRGTGRASPLHAKPSRQRGKGGGRPRLCETAWGSTFTSDNAIQFRVNRVLRPQPNASFAILETFRSCARNWVRTGFQTLFHALAEITGSGLRRRQGKFPARI